MLSTLLGTPNTIDQNLETETKVDTALDIQVVQATCIICHWTLKKKKKKKKKKTLAITNKVTGISSC